MCKASPVHSSSTTDLTPGQPSLPLSAGSPTQASHTVEIPHCEGGSDEKNNLLQAETARGEPMEESLSGLIPASNRPTESTAAPQENQHSNMDTGGILPNGNHETRTPQNNEVMVKSEVNDFSNIPSSVDSDCIQKTDEATAMSGEQEMAIDVKDTLPSTPSSQPLLSPCHGSSLLAVDTRDSPSRWKANNRPVSPAMSTGSRKKIHISRPAATKPETTGSPVSHHTLSSPSHAATSVPTIHVKQ